MALPTGLLANTPSDGSSLAPGSGGLHDWLNELHSAHNLFFDGDYTKRSIFTSARADDTPIVGQGFPGLIANRARRMTILDGSLANPVTQDLATVYISRWMQQDGSLAEPNGLLVAVRNLGNVASAQPTAIAAYAIQFGEGDAAGFTGVGVIDATALHSVRFPTAFGEFGDGTSFSPYGHAIGDNPLVALVSTKPYVAGAAPLSAGVFAQSYPGAYVGSLTGVTFTNASPCVAHKTAHGLKTGWSFIPTGGSLPTGVTAGNVYFVLTIVDADNFTFSATLGGSAVNSSSTGSGTITPYVETGAAFSAFANNPANSQFTATVASNPGAARLATLLSDDAAISFAHDRGVHTYGWKADEASLGYQWYFGSGWNYALVASTHRQTEMTNYYTDFVLANGAWRWTGNGNLLGEFVGNNTPTANKTAFFLTEGVSSTLRQVQWKLQSDLVSGDKVMVLV